MSAIKKVEASSVRNMTMTKLVELPINRRGRYSDFYNVTLNTEHSLKDGGLTVCDMSYGQPGDRRSHVDIMPQIGMYQDSRTGERLVAFSGLLSGRTCIYESDTENWLKAFALASLLKIEIKPWYGYVGSLLV